MPFTPIMRRFLHDVFKPSNALGKRSRDANEDAMPSPLKPTKNSNCLALQNDDLEEDAVVITALNAMPFCCHADLLTMSRDQLVVVADTLNTKLPIALRIDTSGPDSLIRSSIEVLVGIRRDVPPAPRAKRSLSIAFSSSGDFADASSNSFVSNSSVSPFTLRNRSNIFSDNSGTPRRLASLREEEEGPTPSDRPQKRRRTIASSPIPTPVQRERIVLRSQSHRGGPLRPRVSAAKPPSTTVLRSQSQRLPDLKFEHAFKNVTTARGRGRAMSQSAIMTSTPKARQFPARVSEIVPITEDVNFSMSSTTSTSTTAILDSTPGRRGFRGRLDYSGHQSSDDAPEVTSGLRSMQMSDGSVSSDMDISLE